MIKKKTVFILGAGASVPFGYPAGSGLRDEVIAEKYNSEIVQALNSYDDDKKPFQQEVKIFREVLSGAGNYAIDSFLESRPEFADMAKTLIARVLISYEESSRLIPTNGNWYMYLLNRMGRLEELGQNNISFITFNYDRSLEHYLFEAIRKRSGTGSPECAEMMKNFPIVHLYGQLDHLPWQEEQGSTEYSSTVNLIERLRTAKTNIQLINCERDPKDNKHFEDAYRLLGKAERIFFLGFGFDETNLERLQVEYMGNKQIFATTFELDPAVLTWAKGYFAKRSVNISLYPIDALSMLESYLPIE